MTDIIITDAGIGDETPPRIVIASPPFVPTVGISVSITNEFDTDLTGRYFRGRETP